MNNEEFKMEAPHVCLALSSIIMALMHTIKNKRAESLGGWDKAVRKQGVIDMTDQTIKDIAEVEERFFFVIDELAKIADKLPVRVVMNKKKVITKVGDEVTDHIFKTSSIFIDELDRYVDALVHGIEPGVTYLDGIHDAIDMLEHLMLERSCTRVGAFATMRESYKRDAHLETIEEARKAI